MALGLEARVDALQLGVGDVALAKVCRRLNVPRPRQGYWLRLARGASLPKKTLLAPGPDEPADSPGNHDSVLG